VDGDREADRRALRRRMHSTAKLTPKMIHGAATMRSLPVISPAYAAGASGIAVRY
jgi:hypothetical protein